MVTLPPEFVAIRYPGYFWNTKTQELFSLKVGGVLMKLKLQFRNYYHEYDGYALSENGVKRYMPLDQLMLLTPADSVIQIVERPARPVENERWYKTRVQNQGRKYQEPRA